MGVELGAVTPVRLERFIRYAVVIAGWHRMVDEQAVIAFLRQLDRALSEALRGDEQRRVRRLTVAHALVMTVLSEPRQLDRALRQAADGLGQLNR